jgi:hypothetical protein
MGHAFGGPWNNLRLVLDRLIGVGLGQVGEGDLVADAGLLLVPVGEGGLAGEDGAGGLGGELRGGEAEGQESECCG